MKAQEKVIKKFGGKIIGYICTDGLGNKTVMDFNRRILGYYDARTDATMDFYRRVIAYGDISGVFFKDEI